MAAAVLINAAMQDVGILLGIPARSREPLGPLAGENIPRPCPRVMPRELYATIGDREPSDHDDSCYVRERRLQAAGGRAAHRRALT